MNVFTRQKLIIAISALVVGVGLTASGFLYYKEKPMPVDVKLVDTDGDGLSDDEEIRRGTDPQNQDTDGDGFSDRAELVSGHSPLEPVQAEQVETESSESRNEPKDGTTHVPPPPVEDILISVIWHAKPIPLRGDISFIENRFAVKKVADSWLQEELYETGAVIEGPFEGYKMVLQITHDMFANYREILAHQVSEDNNIQRFDYGYAIKWPQSSGGEDQQGLRLIGLDVPQEITIPGNLIRLAHDRDMAFFLKEKPIVQPLFVDKGIPVFLTEQQGCLYVVRDDFMASTYKYKLEAVREDGLLDITFDDGTKNKDQFDFRRLTCGSSCYPYHFIDENKIDPETDFQLAGTTSQGEKFYELKNQDRIALKDLYKNAAKAPAYEEYIASHPILFWKDPFDRWIRFENRLFIPAAEMCKPVLYLYPTKTTEVNVKVWPTGGMSVSIPAYPEGGWNVRATSEGRLISLIDNSVHPYLVWEGVGLNYRAPEEGFVIKQSEVGAFFDEKLSFMGMNRNEIDDFKQYWVSRLSFDPYYFITFVPQEQIDELAPLEIIPRPDRVIRVFMDYRGLSAPIEVDTQALTKGKRDGFTVVEWGGAGR